MSSAPTGARIPDEVHRGRGWVVSGLVPDFALLDAWALPVEGTRAQAQDALQLLASFDPVTGGPPLVRALFAVRLRLGSALGWDAPAVRTIPGTTELSLVERLPDALRGSADDLPVSPTMRGAAGGFVPLYRTEDEWAAEISNATVHGVLHLGWAAHGDGYRGELAVYVKARGPLGRAYLALIEPFRQLVVYPSLLRELGRAWAARAG